VLPAGIKFTKAECAALVATLATRGWWGWTQNAATQGEAGIGTITK
jgi:hypothetical protein